ncbi:hypothetical protein U1Q18_046848 [Sarracenia purpurea var. burkii]
MLPSSGLATSFWSLVTALLDSYLRFCSDLKITRRWFNGMSERNVVSWTDMISRCATLGKMGNALLLFDEMPERDIPSWSAVIAGCTQNGQFLEAISLFRRMVVLGEEGPHQDNWPNQITVVCAFSACGHTGMLQLGRCTHGYIYRNDLGSDSFISNALVDMDYAIAPQIELFISVHSFGCGTVALKLFISTSAPDRWA